MSINEYNENGVTKLMELAQKGDEESFFTEIQKHKDANLSIKAKEKTVYAGYSVIHFLAENSKSFSILSRLIQKRESYKLDIQEVENTGRSFLHLAALKGNHKAIKLLIPLYDQDFINLKDSHGRTALMLGCSQGHWNAVCSIIEVSKNDLDISDNDLNTALHHCFQALSQPLFGYNYPLLPSHFECAMELIKNGADIELINSVKDTALDYVEENSSDILEFVSAYPELFVNDKSIEEVASISRETLLKNNIPEEDIELFEKAVKGFREAEERDNEIRKTRGSCPFVDSSCVPKIRKFRDQRKLQEQLEKVRKMDTNSSFSSMGGIKPNHNQFGEYQDIKESQQGVCPMGFVGPKPTNHSNLSQLSPEEIETLREQNLEIKKDSFWRKLLTSTSVLFAASAAFIAVYLAQTYIKPKAI